MNDRAVAQTHGTARTARKPATTGLLQRKCACGGSSGLTGECADCGEKRLTVQRYSTSSAAPDLAPPIVHEVLGSPGQSLDGGIRASMESRFGHDFGRVRVHTDARSAASAQAVNALAYTVGEHIVFDRDRYKPETEAGKRLLIHELTHTVQQRGALDIARPEDNASAEAEADRNARQWSGEGSLRAVAAAPVGSLLRQKPPAQPPDPDVERILRVAGAAKRDIAFRAHEVFWRILHKYFPKEGRKLAGSGFDEKIPGLSTDFKEGVEKQGKVTISRSAPIVIIGRKFVDATDAAHLPERVKEVAAELEKIDQWRLKTFRIDAEDLTNTKITDELKVKSADEIRDYMIRVKHSDVKDHLSELLIGKLAGSDLGKPVMVDWLRSLDTDTIKDYQGKTKDPRVKQLLGNLLVISTPTEKTSEKIGEINVVIKKDVRDATDVKGESGDTGAILKQEPAAIPSFGWDKDNKVKNFPGFKPKITVEIQTKYKKTADLDKKTPYGRGTTPEDIKADTKTLRFHEGSHGVEILNFLRSTPFPKFEGKNKMDKDEFEAAIRKYRDEYDAFGKELDAHHIKQVDCVGTTIDEYMRGKDPSWTPICKKK